MSENRKKLSDKASTDSLPSKKRGCSANSATDPQRDGEKETIEKIMKARRNLAPKLKNDGESWKRTPGKGKLDGVFSMVQTFASGDFDFCAHLLNQVMNTTGSPHLTEQAINGSIAGILGIAPKNETEALLATQMVACHNVAMTCLRRATTMIDPNVNAYLKSPCM